MSKARLIVEWDRTAWVVGWCDDEDGLGLILGPREARGEDADTDAAVRAIASLDGVGKPDWTNASGEWRWETGGGARAALRVAKAAIKANDGKRPLPAWAVSALAAGWKAPRGWRP